MALPLFEELAPPLFPIDASFPNAKPAFVIAVLASFRVKPSKFGIIPIPFEEDHRPKFSIWNLRRQIANKNPGIGIYL